MYLQSLLLPLLLWQQLELSPSPHGASPRLLCHILSQASTGVFLADICAAVAAGSGGAIVPSPSINVTFVWQKLSAGGGVSNFTVTGPPAAASDSTIWGLSPTAFAALWVLLVLLVLAFCCVACLYWSWRSKEVKGVAGQSRIDERHVNELWDEHQRPGAKPQVKKQRAGIAADAPMPRATELPPRELPTDAEAGAG